MDTVLEPSCVIAALQILVNPKQHDKSDTKIVSNFSDILVDNMTIFEKTIKSDERFHQFYTAWQSDCVVTVSETEPGMWRFVLYCLKCLHLLQQTLADSVNLYNKSSHPLHKPTAAPKMSPDTLSFNEQKVVKATIQFIVCIGICPRLQAGVGIPMELRSGYSHIVDTSVTDEESSSVKNAQLYTCIQVLLSCTSSPVLGTLVLTQHLSDIMAVLFQLSHIDTVKIEKSVTDGPTKVKPEKSVTDGPTKVKPEKSVTDGPTKAKPEKSVTDGPTKAKPEKSVTDETAKAKPEKSVTDETAKAKPEKSVTDEMSITKPADNTGLKDEDTCITTVDKMSLENCNPAEIVDIVRREFTDVTIDVNYCKEKLNELIRKVYPPLVVRTLMLLQGGPPKSITKKIPGLCATPNWLKQECGHHLLSIILRPKGVQSIMRGMLDVPGAGKGMTDTYDWRKCEAVAKVIACCPRQSVTSDIFYKSVGSQVLDLVHIKDVEVCQQFLRVACSMISIMLTQHSTLTDTYVIQPLLQPLLMCNENSMYDITTSLEVVVNESQLTRCIEDCSKVFVEGCGGNVTLISCIQPVLLSLFELFIFTSQGVSPFRSSCQELIVCFLKQCDSSVAVRCLECMAFHQRHSDIQLPSLHQRRSDVQLPSLHQRRSDVQLPRLHQRHSDVQLPSLHQNMKFVHGDDGGVMVVTDLCKSKPDSYDDVCVSCIVTLVEDLQQTDIPGQFLVHMLKELTEFIQSEVHGSSEVPQQCDNTEDSQVLLDIEDRYHTAVSQFQHKLMLLNLLAAVCEKLGPSCINNARHTIEFVKATLERGVQLCKSTEDVVFEAFESETITMAIGLVTALMTGAFEMNEQDRKYLQELLPLLEELGQYHPDTSVREMATDIRIAIATHGAVWSEIEKDKHVQYRHEKKTPNKPRSTCHDKPVGKKIEVISETVTVPTTTGVNTDNTNRVTSSEDTTQSQLDAQNIKPYVAQVSTTNNVKNYVNKRDKTTEVADAKCENNTKDSEKSENKTKDSEKSENKTKDSEKSENKTKDSEKSENKTKDSVVQVDDVDKINSTYSRGIHNDDGLPTGPCIKDNTGTMTELDMAFQELCDPLVPVRGHGLIRLYHLVQNRDPVIENKEELLLKIFEENLDHGDSYIYLSAVNGLTALCEQHAALVVPRLCQQFTGYHGNKDSSKYGKSPELRMKLGEIMVKASRCLGDMLPVYRDMLLPSILCGVKDEEAFVRASSLSNLGEICKLLKFSLGNVIHEIFDCCSSTLKHDVDAEVRKAAAQALTLLLQGLGQHAVNVLEGVLRDLYRVLKSVMQSEKDEVVKLHTHLALNELDDIMRQYLFPKQKLEKRIRVLDFD